MLPETVSNLAEDCPDVESVSSIDLANTPLPPDESLLMDNDNTKFLVDKEVIDDDNTSRFGLYVTCGTIAAYAGFMAWRYLRR